MAHFELKIELDNQAFEEDQEYELARILRQISDDLIIHGSGSRNVKDINGNKIGGYEFIK